MGQEGWVLLGYASAETVYMAGIATLLAILCGLPLGIFLFLSRPQQLLAQAVVHHSLSFLVTVGRSIPFLILMIAMIPVTRWVVGTSIGTNAAIVPLAVAAIPFFARLVDSALLEVQYGVIEAALAMGATTAQIIFKVLLPEARLSLIQGVTLTAITLIGYSAMAGAVGGGGLGDLAVRYGYQRFNTAVMLETMAILVVLVQWTQMAGNGARRYYDRS